MATNSSTCQLCRLSNINPHKYQSGTLSLIPMNQRIHLLSSLCITDYFTTLQPLPPGHNWVCSMVGPPPEMRKWIRSILYGKKSNELHVLSQHPSAYQARPAPDVQWPATLYLVWTLYETVAFLNYQRLYHLMAGPVDRIVQSVPLWIKIVPQLWVSPLFLKVGFVFTTVSIRDNLPPVRREQ